MNNKHFLYHILMAYETICSVLLIFFCIMIARLGIRNFKYVTVSVIIIQVFEILIYILFFYKPCKKFSFITTLMNLVVCKHFFFLGTDFATKTFRKSQTPVATLVLEILFIVYLILCRRIRINELNHKFNKNADLATGVEKNESEEG